MPLIVLFFWILFSFLVAKEGGKRVIGYYTTLMLALIISPLITLIIVLLSDQKREDGKDKTLMNLLDEAQKLAFVGKTDECIIKYKELLYESNKRKSVSGAKNQAKVLEYKTIAIDALNQMGVSIPEEYK